MQNFLDRNLALLETYDAALAERLRSYVPSGSVEVFQTPQNLDSLRIRRDSSSILVHSGQDPIREAQRWVRTVECNAPYNLMVMGCGLFYHVVQLVKRFQSTLQRLVIVEKDMDVVYAAFSSVNLSDFLRMQNTFFLVDPTPIEVRSFMNRHISAFTLDGLILLEHPASCGLYPDYYRATRSVVEECLQGGEILLRTKVVLGGMIQENIIRNIPHLFTLPTVSVFSNLFARIPAFVVGAGPSLDRNIDYLAQVGDRGVIIAADTVFRVLRERGIEPHVVVTTDPTELNASHFAGIQNLGETVLIFSPSVYHEIPPRLNGAKSIIPLPTSRLLNLFSVIRKESNPLPTGVNVGQTCFNLARYMGCSPIVLVGLDFSFPIEGGTTHASGTALQRKIYATDSREAMKVELLDERRSLETFQPIYVPGNTCSQVATNKFWFNYLRSMEQEISQTSAPVFNCTEGGARIEGAEARTLEETVKTYCTIDCQVSNNLQAVIGFFFGEPMTEGIDILEESLRILHSAIDSAEKGLSELSVLETVKNSLSPSGAILREKLDAIHQCHLKLVQDHKIYVVLDEAADSVLQPFLRQDCRPTGDTTSIENIDRAIDRYRPYFDGMKSLCERYTQIVQETLETMRSSRNDSMNSFL